MNSRVEELGSNFIYKTLELVHIQNESGDIGTLMSDA